MRMLWIMIPVALIGLAACSEPPQRLASSAEAGYRTDGWQDQLRGRTLRQGEAGRIYH